MGAKGRKGGRQAPAGELRVIAHPAVPLTPAIEGGEGREGVGVGWETIECVGDVVNDSRPESNLGLNICRRSAHLQGEF